MSSKWGSFLQQAVAGVESRLDNILSEGEYAPDAVKAASSPAPAEGSKATPGPVAQAPQPPTSRPNSRLQQRLAKAVATKSAPVASDGVDGSPAHQSEGAATPRESTEQGQLQPASPTTSGEGNVRDDSKHAPTATEYPAPVSPDGPAPPIYDEEQGTSPPISEVATSSSQAEGNPKNAGEPARCDSEERCPTCGIGQCDIRSVEAKLAEVELMGREERHTHVERADALESKLKFLTREMTESAQRSAASATAGSLERQLAEKDEKIALLMGEGQTLSATEHRQRSAIKKFRLEASERDKSIASLREKNEELSAQLKSLQASETAADSLRSEAETLRAKCNSLQEDSNRLTLECKAKAGTIKSLQLELERTVQAPGSDSPSRAESDAGGAKRVAELDELVTTLRAEKERAAEKARLQVDELRKKADAATEQSRQTKNEVQNLEGKLEAMRVIAEEASSNAAGDAQAKLLRQIETLQSQYATACENWQGIETTLTSRIAILERERDEISQKESSTRRKARDLSSQNRQQAEDLRQLRTQLQDHQQQGDSSQRDLAQLRKRVEAAEASLAKANEQQQASRESDDKIKRGTLPDAIPSHVEQSPRTPGRPLSPFRSPLRTWSSELFMSQPTSKSSHPGSITGASFDGLVIPGSPRDPTGRAGARTPELSDPMSPPVSGKPYSSYDASVDPVAEPLSSQGQPRDDVSDDNADTLSTIHRAIPDIASVSTTAAGPSIQLVERMSAGIRRLEAEKVAGREELLRISSQRDEARAEIVALMKEMESGKQARDRVAALEQEVAEINERYQTTLELLGEKSELVEELRADVQDVKAMYRELVERTVR